MLCLGAFLYAVDGRAVLGERWSTQLLILRGKCCQFVAHRCQGVIEELGSQRLTQNTVASVLRDSMVVAVREDA